ATEQVPELDFYGDGDAVAGVLADLDRFADWARGSAPAFLGEIGATRSAIGANATARSGGGPVQPTIVPRPVLDNDPSATDGSVVGRSERADAAAREVVGRLIGDGPIAGWRIHDVRVSAGLRITLVSADDRERTIILRRPGQPGFYSHPRFSAMIVGRS